MLADRHSLRRQWQKLARGEAGHKPDKRSPATLGAEKQSPKKHSSKKHGLEKHSPEKQSPKKYSPKKHGPEQGNPSASPLAKLQARIQASTALAQRRREALPTIEFPDLPISARREQIAEAIANHQVVIIAGETGSGKTTQIPKICLQLGRGVHGMIGHTQPRRLAASTVAQRIADELHTPLGEGVGFQVRFSDQRSDTTHIKLMTDGILLAEIQNDRFLNRYDTIIIDEAHERSLNVDFLLGYLKQLLPKRPDLKVIVTSATIDLERFSQHFDNAPIIEVSGRTYPVELLYRPLEEMSAEGELAAGIEAAIDELIAGEKSQRGDFLVFLSGEGEIREVARHLRKADWRDCDILPLYARLSNAEQRKVFTGGSRRGRRIVLATNVAETSLTVPGIRYVIDPGNARISRYSYRTKVQRLPIEPISQASANQRKGRCGRVAEGICVRLYAESDFNNRPEFTDPEIQRTNLASVILQMLSMRVGEVDRFPFVEPPDRRMISDGFKLLEELGAVDDKRQLTQIGRSLSRFPIDPRLARMLMAAGEGGCLSEVLAIASALSVQDPRERPADKQQASDEKHRRFQHKESDFLSWVNLWEYYEQQRQELSQNRLRKLCQKEFLSVMRMREWREIHHQLWSACKALGYRQNKEPASYESVHRALLAGLLGHIANLDDQREYLGARNRKLRIFPGSGLFKKNPKWIVAAEIAETSQVYARCCASIQPQWLLGINDSLFKRSYSEPHWHQRSARVMAFETVTLYGLVISDRNRIHYGPIDPAVSCEIFIRGALVEGRIGSQERTAKAPFLLHNQRLVKEIEAMEAKSRRRDILVDEQQLFEFYRQVLPADITTLRRFEQWRKEAEREQSQCLFIDKARLMQHSAGHITQAQFPSSLTAGDLNFSLSYRFEPRHKEDGVSVTIPIGLLNRVPRYRFEWLVPGLLRDKCIALIKLLPKQLRKQMVPVPEHVDKVLRQVQADDVSLLEVLSRQLLQLAGVEVLLDSWKPEQLEDFYRMNCRVVDANGELMGQGRDLEALQHQFQGQMSETLQQQTEQRFSLNGKSEDIREWSFGDLPEQHCFEQAGVTVTSYPALVDRKDSVAIELKDFPQQAEQESQRGIVRLYMLQLPQQMKYLRKELLKGNTISLQLAGISQQREQWLEDLLYAVFFRVFLADQPLPRNEEEFQQRLQTQKNRLSEEALAVAELLSSIAGHYNTVRKQLKKANELSWAFAIADIQQQLTQLFAPGFIADTPWLQLQQYPRYIEAISLRLEKLRGHFQRDKQLSVGLKALSEPLQGEWRNNLDAIARCPLLLEYRWLLEEYRVSLFAQTLGTRQPVSEKRLREQWKAVKQALLSQDVRT